jgi:hypothetical protein
MDRRRLILAFFFPPLAAAIVLMKLGAWLGEPDALFNADTSMQYWWVSNIIGVLVFFFARQMGRWSIAACVVSGLIVFGLVDLVDMSGMIRVYPHSSGLADEWNTAIAVSKISGGIVYGFCYWFIDPFGDVRPRRPTRQNRNYDPYGDF